MQNASVTITNPLVLYRALVSTQKIRPDPAQLRLALHLQKLYERLKDYEPTVEYARRLKGLDQAIGHSAKSSPSSSVSEASQKIEENAQGHARGIWTYLTRERERRGSLALTRVLSEHEEAIKLQSPKGLMVHGEVGTGKSMLIDLFAECLPTRKKRRWHFNTFMLESFQRLEQLRISRLVQKRGDTEDHALLWLARDLVEKSPVLFLDEFQLPDRASAKIMTNLMTGFFSLGGVLVATSNRMPDELAKAAGIEFVQPASARSRWTFGGSQVATRGNKMLGGSAGEYAQFLELLKARCDVWDMEGKSDYRRASSETDKPKDDESISFASASASGNEPAMTTPNEEAGLPLKYFLNALPEELETEIIKSVNDQGPLHTAPVPWLPTSLRVYGRTISAAKSHNGTALFTFEEICGVILGPADYITLASTFHTFLITDVPVLTSLLKNEARRFITLLDALYEAKCKLLISAAADPDNLFFPDLRPSGANASGEKVEVDGDDGVYAETFSEMHQDLTSPFRPNVSIYTDANTAASSPEPDMTHSRMAGILAEDALEDDPPNKIKRGLGLTDSDFLHGQETLQVKRTPNFADTGIFTGEDEKFAYKRAASRLWEMCGRKWWSRPGDPVSWWRPVPIEGRGWERSASSLSDIKTPEVAASIAQIEAQESIRGEGIGDVRDVNEKEDELMFKYGTSPFRNWDEPPPKFGEEHSWGMQRWGKKAGAWGQGVEGLKDRRGKASSG